MADARKQFVRDHRLSMPNSQIESRKTAAEIRRYAADLASMNHGEAQQEWIDWMTAYADEIDPLEKGPLGLPEAPEPSAHLLQPYMEKRRMSAYGPHSRY